MCPYKSGLTSKQFLWRTWKIFWDIIKIRDLRDVLTKPSVRFFFWALEILDALLFHLFNISALLNKQKQFVSKNYYSMM